MYNVKLINMPFAALHSPSLALTQVKGVVESRFADKVSVDLLYLNHDYAKYLGMSLYSYITMSMDAHNSGLGDWFFRQTAFPDVADNTEEYFRRYYPYRSEQVKMLKQLIVEKRRGLNQFMDKLIATYKLTEAAVVGFTSMFSQNIGCFSLAGRIKGYNPGIITVMGGANCEAPMGQEIVKNVKAIDFVFSGPGLKSFPDFIESTMNGDVDKCHTIKGVFSKKNYIFQQPNTIGEEVPIDEKIDLNYHSFLRTLEKNFPSGEIEPTLLFETSRGCWWGERAHCTFCGLNGMTMAYRSMSADRALEQFKQLFAYTNVSHFESVDNILPKNYVAEVLDKLEPPAEASIFYEVKADLSEEEIRILSKARVKTIQPGIESLATSTLKLMKKGTSAFQNLVFLKNCLMHDVFPTWNLLIGFPGEEEEIYKKYLQDLPLLVHLPPPTGAYPVRFDRYSPYFVKAKEYGLDLHPLDFYELAYPFTSESLSNLAYYFADQNIGARYAIVMSKSIEKLRERTTLWSTRWLSDEESPRPKLHFKQKNGSTVVFDSRFDKPVEHELGDLARQILEYLNKPGRLSDLNAQFGHNPGFDAVKEIGVLQEKSLLFHEGERYLSLVVPHEPPTMSIRR